MEAVIKLYSLSTCPKCAAAKDYLDERRIPYDCVYVDRLYAEERNAAMALLGRINPALSFPTLVMGEAVIPGFRPEEIDAALAALRGE